MDVRSWPKSRHHPRFSRENLEPALAEKGLRYRYLGRELGGLRTGGYQAHMETDLFREGMRRLAMLVKQSAVVLLCAERDPAGCHRKFIARVLQAEGVRVRHIIDPGRELLPGERPDDQGTLFDV